MQNAHHKIEKAAPYTVLLAKGSNALLELLHNKFAPVELLDGPNVHQRREAPGADLQAAGRADERREHEHYESPEEVLVRRLHQLERLLQARHRGWFVDALLVQHRGNALVVQPVHDVAAAFRDAEHPVHAVDGDGDPAPAGDDQLTGLGVESPEEPGAEPGGQRGALEPQQSPEPGALYHLPLPSGEVRVQLHDPRRRRAVP